MLRILAPLVFLGGMLQAETLNSPVVIPLVTGPADGTGAERVQIQLGLGGKAAKTYIFDTGSSPLVAAWTKGAPWWGSFKVVDEKPSGSPETYVETRFYYHEVSSKISLGGLTSEADYQVAQAYLKQSKSKSGTWTTDTQWSKDVKAGVPPEEGAFFGTLGADLSDPQAGFYGFLNELSFGPGVTPGFIVHAGGVSPSVTIGITPKNVSDFKVTAKINPGQGGTGFNQHPVNATYAFIQNGVTTKVGTRVKTLFDSGAPTPILTRGKNLVIPDEDIDSNGKLVPGITMQLTIGSLVWHLSSDTTSFSVTGKNTDAEGSVNTSIAFFYSYDIAYETGNGLIAFRVLPEAAYSIPLYQSSVGGPHMEIGVGLNGGPLVPYFLDSGSPNMFATYGSWTPGISVATQVGTDSFSFASGTVYHYNPISVDVALGDFVTQKTAVTAQSVNIAQITNTGSNTPQASAAAWQKSYSAGGTAFDNGTFGNFSAGLYGTSTLASLLPQMPLPPGYKAGYIIKSGGVEDGSVGTLEIGLSQKLIDQYTTGPASISVALNPSGNQIPGPQAADGTPGALLNGVGKAQVSPALTELTPKGGTTPFAYQLPAVLDTGGGDKNIIYRASVDPSLTVNGKNTGQIASGVQFDLSANGKIFYSYVAGTTPSDDLIVADPNYKAAGGFARINPGIAFFFQYNVMFDVADGLLGLTSNPSASGPEIQTIAPFAPIPQQAFGGSLDLTPPAASSGLPVTITVLSGPATLSGDTLMFTGTGKVTLAADQAGNADFKAAAPVRTSFTVGKAAQTITFPALSDKKVGSPAFSLGATSSSGLPVTYRLTGPATLSGNSVKVWAPGKVTVAAYCAGNAQYTTAPLVRQAFVVTP